MRSQPIRAALALSVVAIALGTNIRNSRAENTAVMDVEITDAISREVSVFRPWPTPTITDAISREVSVYREIPCEPPACYMDAISREVGVFKEFPVPQVTDAVSREVSAYSVIPLTLGTPYAGNLPVESFLFFRVTTPVGETVRITLHHDSPTAWTELLASFGATPDSLSAQFAGEAIGTGTREIVIPSTQAGTYFILARATNDTNPNAPKTFSLVATTAVFGIDRVVPTTVGAGIATIEFQGARFSPTTAFAVIDPGTLQAIAPITTRVVDPAHARITFDLTQRSSINPYHAGASDPNGGNAQLLQALRIENAGTNDVYAAVEVGVPFRAGREDSVTVIIRNNGNTDVDYADIWFSVANSSGEGIASASANSPFLDILVREEQTLARCVYRQLAPYESQRMTIRVQPGFGPGHSFVRGAVWTAPYPTADNHEWMQILGGEVRPQVLEDPTIIEPDLREDAFIAAQDEATWRVFWQQLLAASPFAGGVPDSYRDSTIIISQSRTAGLFHGRPHAIATPQDPCACNLDACNVICAGEGIVECSWENLIPLWAPISPCSVACDVYCSFVVPTFCRVANALSPECWQRERLTAGDPNEKDGPGGFSDSKYLGEGVGLEFRVLFENVAIATAPAAEIRITDDLNPSLDPNTVRFTTLKFGDTVIDVPADRNAVQTVVDIRDPLGDEVLQVLVEVKCGVDIDNQQVWCNLKALDPATRQLPADPAQGFLPPNVNPPGGEGFIAFTVKPLPGTATGTVIRNKASIVFDYNDPIVTNEVFNTIDAGAPTSVIELLSAQSATPLVVRWVAQDDAGGSGVAIVDIFVMTDDGPYEPWLTSASDWAYFDGEVGRTYSFYAVSRDFVGNVEDTPAAPDAVTTVTAVRCAGDANYDGTANLLDHSLLLSCLQDVKGATIGGPDIEAASACAEADLNADRRVDLRDFAILQNGYQQPCPP